MAALSPTMRGVIFMVIATFGWTGMMIFVRLLVDDYSTFEILFVRNAVALIVLAPLLMRSGLGVLRTGRPWLHVLRATLSYLGMLGLYYGISLIPLGDVVALSFTQPLFITVLAALMLGEVVGMARWRATVIGFLGVLIIVRPGFAEISGATIAVLVAALLYSASNICIKLLMRTDTPLQAVVYVNLIMLPLALVPALFAWNTPGLADFGLMVGVGLSGTLGVYMLTKSYQVADASAVVPFDFLRLPMTATGAFILFGEVVDLWTW
ncbi:MAG: DMT family transporter, partial [Rhodospirillales bacterium]|nr:DMT family transporter [Rhodospirillales bacterium]